VNVAIFASAFHPHFGGVEELCRQLAMELGRQGHSAIVLTNRWPRSLPRREEVDGIPVYRLPFRTPDAGAKSRVSYMMTHGLVVRETLAVLRRHRIDVLHVQCVSSNAHYALAARRRLRLPLVVTFQGELTMDATGLFQRSEFARQTLHQCAAKAEVVTACSRKTLEDAEAFLSRPIGQGRVVFNAANIEEFSGAQSYQHPRPYLFAIGRLVPQKGFDVLLRAFAASGVTSHDLLLAGDGPEREKLEALAAELRLGDRVRFLGRADRTQVPSLFAGCSFFVLPSRADEGLPVVCAEAMAAGKAVVATRSGGAPEAVLDGTSGLIVEREDVAGLTQAIRTMANDATMRQTFGAAGAERAKLFSWRAVTGDYLAAYATAMASATRGTIAVA
jgi:glycogen(starch) synthase